jgi:hypothetical protein
MYVCTVRVRVNMHWRSPRSGFFLPQATMPSRPWPSPSIDFYSYVTACAREHSKTRPSLAWPSKHGTSCDARPGNKGRGLRPGGQQAQTSKVGLPTLQLLEPPGPPRQKSKSLRAVRAAPDETCGIPPSIRPWFAVCLSIAVSNRSRADLMVRCEVRQEA